jgi:hypothetical protein
MYGLKRQKCHQNIRVMRILTPITIAWRLKPVRKEQKPILESGLIGIR